VRQVTFAHREFQGPFTHQLPDLTVLWDQRFAWDEVISPRIGRLKVRKQDSRSGTHTPTGFLLARGYAAAPGTILPQASLYDIAPTVLHAAGIARPEIMDGRPLFDSLEMKESAAGSA
jgi:predicted AlkP superfamily phosphohydrolase/phosphomutase